MSSSTLPASSGWQRALRTVALALGSGLLAAATWSQAPTPVQPLGSVIDVSGAVTTLRNGAPARLEFFDPVFEAQAIRVPAGGSLVLTHRPSKSEVTVTGPADIEVRPGGVTVLRGAAPQVRVLADYAVVALGRLATQGAARMRSLEGPMDLDLDTVSSTAPLFEWQPAAGSAGYTLTLQEWVNKEPGAELLRVPLTDTRWLPPAPTPLQWGRAYLWTVTADGVVLKKGLRTVVAADVGASLGRLAPRDKDNVAENIIYAQALEWAGARDEARQVWSRIAVLRPDAAQIRRKATP